MAEAFTYRWRVVRVATPDQAAAELTFTQPPGEGHGAVAVASDDPELASLIRYFLVDPMATRTYFFRDAGTLGAPHDRTFGQIDRSLMDFNRRFAAFRAERVDPFPFVDEPDAAAGVPGDPPPPD